MDPHYAPTSGHHVRQITNIPVFQYFSDLPKEIRLKIYEECFTRTYIHFRKPSEHEHLPFITHTVDDEVIPCDNPSLLRVNKFIREEALPIFAQCIASVVLDGPGLAKLPRSYLTHVKEVSLTSPDMPLVDERIAPRLQVLRVWIPFNLDVYITTVSGSTEEELCENVVCVANVSFANTPVYNELLKRSGRDEHGLPLKAQLPFKVYLCLSNLFYGEESGDGWQYHQWDNAVIDWEEEEVVEGFPPPNWHA